MLMQEGAGVRQVIDDELREAGVRLRDLDVRLELGLQESARSAVLGGYGVTFISRAAIEADVAAGTRRRRARRGARARARDLARPLRGPRGDARRAGVRRVRARRGSHDRPLGARRARPRSAASPASTRRCSSRARAGTLPVDVAPARWSEVPSDRVDERAARRATASSRSAAAARSISARRSRRRRGVPLVSVPTTYSGAEWTTYFGVRDPDRKMRGGGAGAHPAGIVYDVDLTLDLPRETTVGTAMNALAHCAEALYVDGHNADADAARARGRAADRRVAAARASTPRTTARRATELLRGACHARRGARRLGPRARARDGAGGRRPLRPAARDAERHLPAARAALERAMGARGRASAFGARSAASRRELAALGGIDAPTRARRAGRGSPELAEAAAGRAGNQANPRPATPTEIEELLRSVW